MPIYEYKCKRNHIFEEIQKFSDDPLKICNICKAPCERILSNSNFALKGSGWYKDGYNSSKPKSVIEQTKKALIAKG